ncbi:MAG: M43 family zinc metalloprotease, partial [Flavobacteriales bacterium]|nr:M43 family zinc metalloprotease [Flavobacteriales bacterium]
AYLPTNPVTWNSDLDGVVILNLCVGNDPNQSNGYRLWPWGSLTNRSVTHEVGHYLGLDHTFEGYSCSETNCNTQGDQICDTPPTEDGSTCNVPACPNTLVENYMDYTSETCQDMFTNGQSTVMRAVLAGTRNALVNTSNCGAANDYDASVSAITVPNGSLCQTTFTPSITLTNYGATTLTSVQIQYYVDANGPTTYNWSGSVAQNASTSFALAPMTTTTGAHTFTATTVSGTLNTNNTDQETNNDESTSSFNVGTSGTAITLTLDLDCYGEEITWEVRNSSNTVVASGGPYVNNASGEQVVESLCLAEGCYDFIINDSFGDGLYGSQWQNCSIDGDYEITDSGGGVLVELTATNSDFGTDATHNFCIGGGGGGTTCDVLMAYDGSGFVINNDDFPNFDVEVIDNDQEAVATTLANANYTSNWMGFYEIPTPPDTNFFARVTSWFADTTQYADNWLNFGQITIPNEGGELRWKHRFVDNDFRDGYEVLVNFSGTAISDFNAATVLFSVGDNDPSTDGDNDWTQQVVDLPSGTYAGQTIYIGFHHDALNMFFLDLDDVEVEGCTSDPVGISERESFQWSVFPNPSSGNFNLNYSDNDNGQLTFLLMNSVGQEVWSQKSSSNSSGSYTIDTQSLSSGIYTLVVRGEKVNVSERLILTQ